MADETPVEAAHSFAQAHQSRIDAALAGALAAKMPADPAATTTTKGAAASSGAARSPGSASPGKGRAAAPTTRRASSQSPAPTTAPSGASGYPTSAPAASETGYAQSSDASATSADPDSTEETPPGAAPAAEADAGEPAADGAQDGASAAEQPAFDVEAVTAAAKKKDLRQVEKILGLEEGVLGATNGEYAALRRRTSEVEAHEAKVQTAEAQLVEKFGPPVALIKAAKAGDIAAYARTIETTTGIPIQVFVEAWAKNIGRLDPRQVQQLTRPASAAAPEPAPNDPPIPAVDPKSAATAKADAYISAEAANHPALKLKDGAKDVREKWLASYDKSSRSFKLTPKKAADAVVEERRAALEQEQWILSGKQPPKKTGTKTIRRQGASETQVRTVTYTREQLIERGAAAMRAAKAREARRHG